MTTADLFNNYGIWFVLVLVFFGQMGIPLGSSFFLMWYGASSQTWQELATNSLFLIVAVSLGDLLAFKIGSVASGTILGLSSRYKALDRLMSKSKALLEQHGVSVVFFSRWLVTGIGPFLNYLLGSQNYSFTQFAVFAVAGEVLFVGIFLSVGFVFQDTWSYLTDLLSEMGWIALLLVVAVVLAQKIMRASHREKIT